MPSGMRAMTESMIEHMARGMYERNDKAYPISSHPWEEVDPRVTTRYRRQARAALKAMREPTKEMIYDGDTVSEDAGDIYDPSGGCNHGGPQCGYEVWQAMIDKALEDG